MFTGLVAGTGTVRAVERSPHGARLEVESPLSAKLTRGDSVAVSGVCLTAVEVAPDRFRADVMDETLARSSLGALARGDAVNLELPLRAGDRLGGHFVQGHVDAVGTVESVASEGLARRVAISAGSKACRYLVDKGSVAVDGVSLTVAEAREERFAVALVPETLERTTLGGLAAGDSVNLEVDVIAKYVERLVPSRAQGAPLATEAP